MNDREVLMFLTYREEPCVEGTLVLRLDVVVEANILSNLVIELLILFRSCFSTLNLFFKTCLLIYHS